MMKQIALLYRGKNYVARKRYKGQLNAKAMGTEGEEITRGKA